MYSCVLMPEGRTVRGRLFVRGFCTNMSMWEEVVAYTHASRSEMSIKAVLESDDCMSIIIKHLVPASFVSLGRVSRDVRVALRAAIGGAPCLLVSAACNAGALTKAQLIGWFALTSAEADALPRSQYVRRRGSGFYYLYRSPAFDRTLKIIVSAEEWETRLCARGGADTSLCDGWVMGRKRSPERFQPQVRGCGASARPLRSFRPLPLAW